ncbi:MAG: TrkH family potassium uptake protein, partial [Aliifodinibius sp.]|nr:TrkH family potassium uptake protein [Fodinibius sp.]NIV15463.1 TrkH family potassium uptake protein [Fodinibius sp.]NIY29317.1 TrkH family potassium uptake protein [Fodinibius sp.]
TTTGYATADFEQWSASSQIFLFLMMFIGGCAGSTGGGMKVMRIFVLMKFVFSEIVRLIHPHAVVSVRFGNTVVPREVLTNMMGFFILFMFLFIIGILAMSAMGFDITTSFGAVAATLGNIGPGLGGVGPTDNYAHIPVVGKWLLSFLMLAGR